jgi:hypothetical protein
MVVSAFERKTETSDTKKEKASTESGAREEEP